MPGLSGQPVLLPVKPDPALVTPDTSPTDSEATLEPARAARIFRVSTFAGSRSIAATPVPSSDGPAWAVLLVDTLTEGDWTRAESELVALWRGLGKRRLKVATASGAHSSLHGPFRNASHLREAIRTSRPPDPTPIPADSSEPQATPGASASITQAPSQGRDQREQRDPYEQIGRIAPVVGHEWNDVLVLGRLPHLPPSLGTAGTAYLSNPLRTHRLRFSFLPLDDSVPSAADWTSRITGGAVVGSVKEYIEYLDYDSFVELRWSVPRPSDGFHLYAAEIVDEDSGSRWLAPSAAAATSWRLPRPDELGRFRKVVEDVSRSVSAAASGSAGVLRARIEALRKVNPADMDLLIASVALRERESEWSGLAEDLRKLSEIRPLDQAILSRLGQVLVRSERWDEAERAFRRVIALAPGSLQVSEALGRVLVRQERYPEALDLFEECLAKNPSNQALWFHTADTARRAHRPALVISALSRGLELPSAPLKRRAELVRLLLEANRAAEAGKHMEIAAESPPRDPELLGVFADLWEELLLPGQALDFWSRAAEFAPDYEPAPAAMARIQIEQGRHEDAIDTAGRALERFPGSASLHDSLTAALEKSNRFYELREALRVAVESVPGDLKLLERRARTEDLFGRNAPTAYRELARGITGTADPAELEAILDRGFLVSLRHNDLAQARWFAQQAEAAGLSFEHLELLDPNPRRQENAVEVPGGMRALASLAGSADTTEPASFFNEYCRRVVAMGNHREDTFEPFSKSLDRYFESVRNLRAMRDSAGDGDFSVTISAKDRRALRKARTVLQVLGWRIVGGARKGYSLRPIESESGAERQEIASALGVDGVGIEEALAEGREFVIHIKMDKAHVTLGEEAWRSALYYGEALSGGFAQAVARNPAIGATYVGLTQMHPAAARHLVSSFGLKRMTARFSADLLMHGSSLTIKDGSVVVPGGPVAATHWTNLAGARPSDPGGFLSRLVQKDQGQLLGYFSSLGQLDVPRQRFFTRTGSRLRRFYELYRSAPEFQGTKRARVRDSPFAELLRQLPLTEDATVAFPGGPEVWMVLKGRADADRLTRRATKKVAPELEDEILARVAKTKFEASQIVRSQVDKFLAVSRIDQHRSKPMAPRTALHFAQAFGPFEPLFPYFATLTGLEAEHIRRLEAFADSLKGIDEIRRNHLLALFHSLTEILCLAQIGDSVSEERAAELFGSLSRGLAAAKTPGDATDAALGIVDSLLKDPGTASASADADHAMARLLGVDWSDSSKDAFDRVLELQSIPRLSTLLTIRDASRALAAGQGDLTVPVAAIDAAVREIPVVAVGKETGLKEERKRLVSSFGSLQVLQAKRRIERSAARRKVRVQELERHTRNLRAALLPQVAAALTGVVYAYYLRPDDLPVAEDPLFLRKHEFFPIGRSFLTTFFSRSALKGVGEATGSFAAGGFGDFANTAGHISRFALRSLDGQSAALGQAQLASLRSVRWQTLRETDVRRFVMTVLLGREWVVAAAYADPLRSALAEAVAGVLSVGRSQRLFQSLDDRHWDSVWDFLSLTDLHWIGEACLASGLAASLESPVATTIASLPNPATSPSRIHALGSLRTEAFNDSRPRLWRDAPYEEFERYNSDKRIAERSAELHLYLAVAADWMGLGVAWLAAAAEESAKHVLSAVDMVDLWDWRSALRTFEAESQAALQEVTAQ